MGMVSEDDGMINPQKRGMADLQNACPSGMASLSLYPWALTINVTVIFTVTLASILTLTLTS